MVAIVTVAEALLAGATMAPYSYVSAKKHGDSNAQTSAANNDCPADVALLAQIAVQRKSYTMDISANSPPLINTTIMQIYALFA